MKHYYIIYDDGAQVPLLADSAADAIGKALRQRLGHKVINCFVGGYDANGNPNHDRYPGGRTDFEVPPHDALVSKPARPFVRKPTRGEAELFDDAAVVAESEKSKTNAERERAIEEAPYTIQPEPKADGEPQ